MIDKKGMSSNALIIFLYPLFINNNFILKYLFVKIKDGPAKQVRLLVLIFNSRLGEEALRVGMFDTLHLGHEISKLDNSRRRAVTG